MLKPKSVSFISQSTGLIAGKELIKKLTEFDQWLIEFTVNLLKIVK